MNSFMKGTKLKSYFVQPTAADCYSMNNGFKPPEGISNQIVAGLMAFIMGIVTMVRLTRNMPKKMTDANLYSDMYCYDSIAKSPGHELAVPSISNDAFMTVMKRMAAMEEKLLAMAVKPDAITEKEEMLQVASNRVDALEHELAATKKVFLFNSNNIFMDHQTSFFDSIPECDTTLVHFFFTYSILGVGRCPVKARGALSFHGEEKEEEEALCVVKERRRFN